jgi:hypothetical protein
MFYKIIDKAKEVMYVAVIIALLGGVYAAVSFVSTYSKSIQPSSFRSFSVSGEGKVTAIPDVAQFSFSVITEGGKDIAKIQKENTDKVNGAIAFVKSKNVDDKDIKTQNYSLDPHYQYYDCGRVYSNDTGKVIPCPPPAIVGYTINQSVSVKVRDFSKIGDILSGVIQNGANSVSQLSFTIDNSDSIKNQARTEAIEKAKVNAESIAKAGGFGLGRLLSIEEGGYNPQPMYSYAKGMGIGGEMSADSRIAPSIEPGSQETIINVILRYEIK